ncbi:hypothetical protein DVH05_017307 [Phytophthora capsici]|nr:hypothetical protein DVH05_017307 [Phytophthora capsici]
MDEEFQDFGSDCSDFDDDVDWSFTDGESASILQLLGGSDSAQKQKVGEKTSSGNLSAHEDNSSLSTVNGTEAMKAPISDEELLDELFPQSKPEPADNVDKPEPSSSKECEVEWALMALEEHEQLGRQSRSVSPTKGDADFVSLFEEMYGGDAAIELSTPSPRAKLDKKRQDCGNTHDEEQFGDSVSSKDVKGKLPDEFLDMVRQIHKKAIEVMQFYCVRWCITLANMVNTLVTSGHCVSCGRNMLQPLLTSILLQTRPTFLRGSYLLSRRKLKQRGSCQLVCSNS